MRNIIGYLLLSLTATGLCQAAPSCTSVPGNLLANCGFHTGDFTSWTVSGNDVPRFLNILYGVEGVDPLNGIVPHSGLQQAFFADPVTNATTLGQIVSTVVGASYTISFYVAQDTKVSPPYHNSLTASFGATTLASLTDVPVEGYTLYDYTAMATSTSTALDLTFGNDLGEFLLSDVVVTRGAANAPEPSAALLFAAGVASLGGFRFRAGRKIRYAVVGVSA